MAAVATVARGDVLNNLEWASAIDADRDFAKAQLGRREREILHLYASGLPLKLAAQQLGIGYSTAREYLDRIRVKYVEVGRPAPTKVDLLRRAVEDGILPGLDCGRRRWPLTEPRRVRPRSAEAAHATRSAARCSTRSSRAL